MHAATFFQGPAREIPTNDSTGRATFAMSESAPSPRLRAEQQKLTDPDSYVFEQHQAAIDALDADACCRCRSC
jgi:hypothetical protein